MAEKKSDLKNDRKKRALHEKRTHGRIVDKEGSRDMKKFYKTSEGRKAIIKREKTKAKRRKAGWYK